MRTPENGCLVVCIDGGPCSGKSSVLAELETADFGVPTRYIPELATAYGEELLARGTNYPRLAVENRERYLEYQERIAAGYMEQITAARHDMETTGGLVLMDRGAAGVRSYVNEVEWDELTARLGTDPERIKHEYADAVVFLGSLAIENPGRYGDMCRSNPLRTETVQEAAVLHYRSLSNWEGHDTLLEVGGDDVLVKSQKAADFIRGLLAGGGEMQYGSAPAALLSSI